MTLESPLLEGSHRNNEPEVAQDHHNGTNIRRNGYVLPPRRQDWSQAAAILVAELVGTGVLALPHSFQVLGWLLGTFILVIFSALTLYAGILLWRLQQRHPGGITYSDIAFIVGGERAKAIVFSFIFCAFFGNLGIYILTCAESLQTALYDFPELCKWYMTVATVIFLLPICQLRTLYHVSYAAFFSSLSILLCLVIVLFSSVPINREERGQIYPLKEEYTFSKFVATSTTAIFSFGGQGLYFETMAEMKNPGEFPKALSSTTSGILSLYLIVSIFCYLWYGECISPNILYNMENGFAKRIASFLVFFHVSVSYVIASQVIGRVILVRVAPKIVDSEKKEERLIWLIISTSLLIASWLLANVVPFLHQLMGIVGAVTTAPLTFGIPPLLILLDSAKDGKLHELMLLERVIMLFLVFLALFLMVAGLYSNWIEIGHSISQFGHPFSCKLTNSTSRCR